MKKIFLGLFLLFITSCQSYSPIESFDVSENCPHVCWLRINPGTTNKADAITVLHNTNRIRQKTIIVDESGIGAEWFVGASFPIDASITFKDDLVKEVILSGIAPMTISDFIPSFGEPDYIETTLKLAADARYIDYILFYSTKQLGILASTINNNGPDLKDNISMIVLTTDLSKSNWFANSYQNRQRWLGFGHLKDYFPGQKIPPLGSWAP